MGENLPSVYVKTLGCKVNTFDGHVLENQFAAVGYELAGDARSADITVVNTCSVTANADREARYLARRIRRDRPDAMIVFTGCYAQTDSARLVAMDEIDFVVPNEVKDRLVTIVQAGLASREGSPGAPPPKLPADVEAIADNRQSHFKSSVTFFDRAGSAMTRAFVKVQDGCNGFCAYCLIPYARGASRSVPAAQVLAEIRRLVEGGSREIVLTGIHIGDYGRDFAGSQGGDPIVPLIREILEVPGLERLRISSLEPAELTPDLADLLGSRPDVVCDHLHLPLQSGSDAVLKRMRRAYDTKGYRDAIARFRAHYPEASIGADVIPGFPGETAFDFQATVELIEALELSYLHVFPYSRRPNTSADRMPGHLADSLIKERAATLRQLSEELATRYARRFVGRTLPVLWEDDADAQGRRLGRTRNYLHVACAGPDQPKPGTMGPATLKGFVEQGRLLARAAARSPCFDRPTLN